MVVSFHAAAGYPVRDTWLKAIKTGNYDSWLVLTYTNATKYCPLADKNIKSHTVQTFQGVRSTKPKNPSTIGFQELHEIDEPKPGNDSVNELYVQVIKKRILFTDDTERFPIRARSGNQFVMVTYLSSNVILVEPFSSRKYKNRLAAYNYIMQRLKDKYLLVDLHILDNECSKEYQATIRNRWEVQLQLVPPDMHR